MLRNFEQLEKLNENNQTFNYSNKLQKHVYMCLFSMARLIQNKFNLDAVRFRTGNTYGVTEKKYYKKKRYNYHMIKAKGNGIENPDLRDDVIYILVPNRIRICSYILHKTF